MVVRAEEGDPTSQYFLALMYRSGMQGIEVNSQEARGWLLKASEQGHTKAQFTLGIMHANGEGGLADFVQAYMWFTVAAGAVEGNARTTYLRARDQVQAQMTPERVSEASRMARDWTPNSVQED